MNELTNFREKYLFCNFYNNMKKSSKIPNIINFSNKYKTKIRKSLIHSNKMALIVPNNN